MCGGCTSIECLTYIYNTSFLCVVGEIECFLVLIYIYNTFSCLCGVLLLNVWLANFWDWWLKIMLLPFDLLIELRLHCFWTFDEHNWQLKMLKDVMTKKSRKQVYGAVIMRKVRSPYFLAECFAWSLAALSVGGLLLVFNALRERHNHGWSLWDQSY